MRDFIIHLLKDITLDYEQLNQVYFDELNQGKRLSVLNEINRKQRELIIVREYLEEKLMKEGD